jgi:hypothetical protein
MSESAKAGYTPPARSIWGIQRASYALRPNA